MGRFTVALLVAIVLISSPAVFAVDIETKSGAIQFSGPKKDGIKLSIGKKIKFSPELKQITVGKGNAVSVGGEAENTTDQKIFYSYHIAFLDKDKNVIGCHAYNLWFDPGKKKGHIGTFIGLPPEQIAKIASYTLIFYEDDEQIGNK